MNRMRSSIVIFLGLIVVVTFGYALETGEIFIPLKQHFQSKSVPAELLTFGSRGRILNQTGTFKYVPNKYVQFLKSNKDDPAVFNKKRLILQAEMPSSIIIKKEDFKGSWPLLSVVVGPDELYNPKWGIITNYKGRGRKWERQAYVSYFENRELLFATGAGLRLHGGANRKEGRNFRLYFRKEYGEEQFKDGVLLRPNTGPFKTLVLRKDWVRGFYHQEFLTASITFEISKRIGAIVPAFKPMLFYLNGNYLGVYTITEHLKKYQWISHFKHDNFLFYRYRGKSNDESKERYRELGNWARNYPNKMTMDEVDKYVNIDNLSRHLFSIIFCGTDDWNQGAAIFDKSQDKPKWFWVNWDMDHSFYVPADKLKKIKGEWQKEAFELVIYKKNFRQETLKHMIISKGNVRSVLFTRLWNESPKYRRYFVRLVMDLLNHPLSPDHLDSLIEYYIDLARSVNESYFSDLMFKTLLGRKVFMKERPKFIRKQMEQLLHTGKSYPVHVKGPSGIKYEIDGYQEQAGYKGFYFSGFNLDIKITSSHRNTFLYWLVNGKKIEFDHLVYQVDSVTLIEPVFYNKSL